MNQEQQFARILEQIKRTAREQGNCVREAQVQEAFAPLHFDGDQLKMVFDYLAEQKISIGEPANPEDYMTEEEINCLHSYLESLNSRDELSPGEREAITLSAMAGDPTARERLIESWLVQVVDIARLYAGQGALMEDLIGEGNVALTMAVEMLDTVESVEEAHGFLGSMIMEAMENHISENMKEKDAGNRMADKVNQVADQARELAQSLGRKVTVQELADETGMTLYDIKEAVRFSGDAIEDLNTSGSEN